MKYRYIIWTLMVLSVLSCIQKQADDTEQFLNMIDERMPKLLHDFSVPGAAIAIIDSGEVVHMKGYGYANLEMKKKVTEKTGFNIASISKTIAAWGIMKLVKDGKIDLDASAEKYLSRWKLPHSEHNSEEVTIRRLLSHTAGLSLHGYGGWKPEDTLPTIEESLDGKTNGAGRVEIILKPGTKYQYSGGGYTVLQLIIEEVSGLPFEEYIQQEVLNQLGMTNSSFKIDENILAASAAEYDNFGEKIPFELFTAKAAAGLHTNIEDFTKFTLANFYLLQQQNKDAQVLPQLMIQQMMEPQPNTNEGYGLGYELGRGNLTGLIGHTGGNSGWQSMFQIDPKTNDGFVVFANGGAGYNIINVLLCEWLNWKSNEPIWEDCSIKPSIADKLKQIIDDEGIENAGKHYASLKRTQGDTYNFAENQLNNLGYYYLARKELENAKSIFKLNKETFPNSGNVYDSYAEALLAQNFREEAIYNYKKSIQLNPGNQHGIGVMNDLGISNNDIINEISVKLDKELIAGYTGFYKNINGDTINIKKQNGKLVAKIQGQKAFLISQSELRFVTFGEGSTITFFNTVTGQKGLWSKQSVWRKLPNTFNTPINNNFLVFRNNPSWRRPTDFENVLSEFGYNHDQYESNKMTEVNLSNYNVIIIPGAQNKEFYNDYIKNIERFDEFVKRGGTLLLELNGAEKHDSLILPRGVTISLHKALENTIVQPEHPILIPLSGKPLIHARYVSNGYFQNVPDDAMLLAIESEEKEMFKNHPTFIEYSFGKGQVIAAMQCFHDRDDSGRGPLMESIINYTLLKSWKNQE